MVNHVAARVAFVAILLVTHCPISRSAPATDPATPDGGTVAAKVPVPSGEAQAVALTKIKSTFASDYAKHSAADRLALCSRLEYRANRSENPDEKFVLLREAANIAAQAGDVDVAAKALAEMDDSFSGDIRAVRMEVLTAASRAVHLPAPNGVLAQQFMATGESYVAAGDFDAANHAATLADAAARASRDAGIVSAIHGRARDIEEIANQYRRLAPAFQTLAKDPANAEANYKAGRFYCMVMGDWDKGLPLLAKGSDAKLKQLAEKDIEASNTTDSDIRVSIGDRWWDAGKAEGGAAETGCRHRAAKWYELARNDVDDATKQRILSRLSFSADNTAAVNVLEMIDPRTNAAGAWAVQKGTLKSPAEGAPRVQAGYHPAAEYTVSLGFTPLGGKMSVALILPIASGSMAFATHGNNFGFQLIKGQTIDGDNRSAKKAARSLQAGKHYTLRVEVRTHQTTAFVDNELVSQWPTDDPNISASPAYTLPDKKCLGIGTWDTEAVFDSMMVVNISGQGTRIPK